MIAIITKYKKRYDDYIYKYNITTAFHVSSKEHLLGRHITGVILLDDDVEKSLLNEALIRFSNRYTADKVEQR